MHCSERLQQVSTHILSRDCLLQQTVLLDVLEHEGATHHVGGYQDDDTNLGEHEGQNDLQKINKKGCIKERDEKFVNVERRFA